MFLIYAEKPNPDRNAHDRITFPIERTDECINDLMIQRENEEANERRDERTNSTDERAIEVCVGIISRFCSAGGKGISYF